MRFGERATVRKWVSHLKKKGYLDWIAWFLAQEVALTAAMLELGVDIHVNNDKALFYTIVNQRLKLLKYLVVHGINIHVNHEEGLRFAAEGGYSKIVEYLVIECGAKVDLIHVRAAQDNSHPKVAAFLRRHWKRDGS